MKTLYHFATTLLLTASCLLPAATQAQPGTLDLTFGTGGLVTTSMGSGEDKINAMVIQPDGKIVVAGSKIVTGIDNDFALARYNSNGTLDNTFGTGGKVITDLFGGDDVAYAVALQPDGKIVAAGYTDLEPLGNGVIYHFAVVRYDSVGVLDNTFGSGGIATTWFVNSISGSFCRAMGIQSNGKIIVAGSGNGGPDLDFYLARFTADGLLDNTFGTAGQVITNLGAAGDFCYSLAIQADDKIVAAGSSDRGPGILDDFAMVRYTADGSPDNTFGTNGVVITTISPSRDYIFSVAMQGDGKIVAAGTTVGSNYDYALARYDSSGILDNTFGTGGIVTTDFVNSQDYGRAVAIQQDGKIVLAGNVPTAQNDFGLVRYDSVGTLDNTFGTGGIVTTDFLSVSDDYAYVVAIQGDGKIVAAGNTYGDFALARYNNDDGTVGVDEIKNENPFVVSPNPFINELSIKGTKENEEISIFDVMGKEILKQSTSEGETKFNTSTISPGFYLLHYASGKATENFKVVKL